MRFCSTLLPSAICLAAAADAHTVRTSKGLILGGKCASTSVNYFFSIPFAEPPTGDLRYAAPQPLSNSYDGTLNGTMTAPSCIQFSSAFAESGAQSEDW
jgi:carboxylesterase type B